MQAVAAAALTWPLAVSLGRLPLGEEPAATVPFFNLWTLRWTADRLGHGLAGWWDAPIFWPARGTFAASEPQPLTGAAFAVLRPAVGDGAAYGLLVLLALFALGLATAALARRLGAGPAAAGVAGVLGQAVPFVHHELGVLQLVVLWPVPAALAALLGWHRDPSPGAGLRLGLAVAAAAGTCGYYAVLLAACLVPCVAALAGREWWAERRVRAGSALVAIGVAAALVAPLALAQAARVEGRRWADRTVLAGSARGADWLPGGERWPGVGLVVLAAAGIVLGRRRREVRALLAFGIAAFLLALGTRLRVGGVRPWDEAAAVLRPLQGLRSPFRAAALAEVALVGCSVPALAALLPDGSRVRALRNPQRPHSRTRARWVGRVVGVVAVVAAVAGSWAGAGPLVAVPGAGGAGEAWLAAHPDGRPVVVLPFAPGPAAADFEATTVAMLRALDHGHPLVNGYSGFFPPWHAELRRLLAGFPDRTSLAELQRRGVELVLVDAAWFDAERREAAAVLGIDVLADGAGSALLRLPAAAFSSAGVAETATVALENGG